MSRFLKDNVKERVHDIGDTGLHLLKRGQKGLFHALFSRFGLVLLLLVLQVGILFSMFYRFGQLLPHYFGGTTVLEIIMVVYLINTDMDNSAKITWLVVMAVVPVLGIPLFWYTKSNLGHNMLRKQVLTQGLEMRLHLHQDEVAQHTLQKLDPGAAALGNYLMGRGGGFPVYGDTRTTYFPGGEAMLDELLDQLGRAEKYIFVEYFIIDEGIMWGRILEVLARKAAEGVDVRVMYDGTCEFSTLPRDYAQRLAKLGIRGQAFAAVQPLVSTHYNYRDHRKILVIDGRVGFTGGVNLADEYINAIEKYGRWKDAALMLEGAAVQSLTALFLQMWTVATGARVEEYKQFLAPQDAAKAPDGATGFAAPYGDSPLDGERVGELVYIDLINRAQRYIHIMTPYLILDGELETALVFAAARGVDVHLILPGIPDKRMVYSLAKNHYAALLKAGVKISEWQPGFVHAKVFAVDGREAVVGTINLDYRSLYHHFENAVWLVDAACIADIEADFQATLSDCRHVELSAASIWKGHALLQPIGALLKLLAPLL